ncbi:MAG: hypothetical protein OHM56_00245 [Spiroplasma phoeniceum]|nr:MAG: hypothetical protein OHM57_12755 [Spiroplasma phoeniceum]UZQ32466.1 MAG: hypothetical protein OHM56_00245 [Spiroplasma phoeniceum]
MIIYIKTGHLYFLRNGKIICIDRMDPNEMFFAGNAQDKNNFLIYNVYIEDNVTEACNKKEYILLRNAKLDDKLLYLHSKEIIFLKLAEIKAPLLVDGVHVRVQEKIFDYQEALARRYNEELVEKLTEEDKIQYRYAHQKRTNHFWHRKKS